MTLRYGRSIKLVELDWITAASFAFGGSGISVWLLTYLQLREERRKRGQEYFRQIVLTPEFLSMLGRSFSLIYFASYMNNEADFEGHIGELATSLTEYRKAIDAVHNKGTLFFLPAKLFLQITQTDVAISNLLGYVANKDFVNASKAYEVTVKEIGKISDELKRLIGIDAIE